MYRIRICQSPQWKQHDCCRIGISVGNLSFEGNKLQALLSWTHSRFDRCLLYVADTLQRHNYVWQLEMSEQEAFQKALESGDRWLSRNQSILEQYFTLQNISYWENWRNSESFQSLHEQVTRISQGNAAIEAALHRDTENFLRRHNLTHPSSKALAYQKCRDFLIEEVVVHTLMARERRAAKLYPAKQLETLKVFRKRSIEDVPVGLDNEDYIRFTFLRAKI
ncbi:tRNA-dependent cyclodipeptide synthase [Roseofilum casamattae]|uniref:Cyclodipeptide synthase n=1 Tax=Roseofilum casamattae BLCC-M143 TaxID=3022442 RepID=A0ABT7BTJ6_9CYAN|nr:tRNA-dependent cyclodipeptide synthase [Roseofilum casamattae]MDJ1182508.1 tRNA-dependent cyclodipeptide synthase [Roseofilum casamattae BLCC-M143]